MFCCISTSQLILHRYLLNLRSPTFSSSAQRAPRPDASPLVHSKGIRPMAMSLKNHLPIGPDEILSQCIWYCNPKKQVFTDDLRTILLPSTHPIMLEEKLKNKKTNQKQTQIEELKK